MKDEQQGALLAGGLGIGLLVGIVLSFILRSSPLIGDCGTNVEINKFYLYIGLFATKFLFTLGCAMGGLVAGLIVMGVIELYLRTKKAISSRGERRIAVEHIHRKYNYRYFVNKAVDIASEGTFVLIAWGIGIALYVMTLRMSPEICYISDKTRADFILSTGFSATVLSVTIGGCIYGLVKRFSYEIRQYLIGEVDECNDLDSIACKCNTPELESMFDKDIYTVSPNIAQVSYTDKNGATHILSFRLYNWRFDQYYRVDNTIIDGTLRVDEYHGYTLRQVIAETLKVCKKYQG